MKLEGRAGTITIRVEIDSIEPSGDDLIIRGRIMDMPSVIRVTPEEFWASRRLVRFRLLPHLARILWKGWRRCRACSSSVDAVL